jgi:hypothetical protein
MWSNRTYQLANIGLWGGDEKDIGMMKFDKSAGVAGARMAEKALRKMQNSSLGINPQKGRRIVPNLLRERLHLSGCIHA